MPTSPHSNIANIIGSRIRKARKELGLTQDYIAAPVFTKGYVSALERGMVSPSIKALVHIASRLELPISYFIVGVELGSSPAQGERSLADLELNALEGDLNYQYDIAHLLIRQGKEASIKEAHSIIEIAEQQASAYKGRLSANLLYRPHFLRGLAFLQTSQPALALPELEKALEAAQPDEDAVIRAQNMLGVAHYMSGHASDALELHLRCLSGIDGDVEKDSSRRLSILRNLADDYQALHDVSKATATYKAALPLVDDLSGIERQASLFSALAMSYRAANDTAQAKLYASQALILYQRLDDEEGAASVSLHLGELFLQDGRIENAQNMLDRASGFLEENSDPVLLATMHTDYAELQRKQGDLDGAAAQAMKGLSIISTNNTGDNVKSGAQATSGRKALRATASPSVSVLKAHVEALHVSALIEEDRGNFQEVSRLFEQAILLVQGTSLTELAYTIAISYATILNERGEYKLAADHYRMAAQLQPHPTRASV